MKTSASKFNPEVGFIERKAIHQYFGQFAYKPRPKFIPHVQQMEFETQIEYYTDRAGKLATGKPNSPGTLSLRIHRNFSSVRSKL